MMSKYGSSACTSICQIDRRAVAKCAETSCRVPSLNLWVGALLIVYSVAWLAVILAEKPEKSRNSVDAKKAT